jgi:hypothetical protein
VGKTREQARRCLACARRIGDDDPYIGIEDTRTGREMRYHGLATCQHVAAGQFGMMMEGGALYLIHHYHTCGDEENGFDCAGGCFSGELVLGRN